MVMKTKAPSRNRSYTLGRKNFAKISEVEGIYLSRELEADFRELDRRSLSPAERRRVLAQKYGPKA
jgi:hypothetical protein